LGFKQALQEHGIKFNDENLITCNLTPEDGTEAALEITKRKKIPDGILVTNDLCAASCMKELKKHGLKIPSDIAVAGFNNDPVSNLIEPPLTTINYKGYEMGEIAIQTMINQLQQSQNINFTQSIVIGHELIIRESTLKTTTKS
jgi:LacI family transcriptional regulator